MILLWAVTVLTQVIPSTSGAIRDRVIDSYLEELKGQDLNHPDIIRVIDIILDKMDLASDTCLKTVNTTCVARLQPEKERATRQTSSTMAYLKEYITTLAKQHFPKVLSVVKNVMSNSSEITDRADQFSTTADLLILKTVSKANTIIDQIKLYKAPMATISALILVCTFVLLFSCIANSCEKMHDAKRKRKAEKLEMYWQRRQQAHEL